MKHYPLKKNTQTFYDTITLTIKNTTPFIMTRSLWRQLLTISGDQQISNQWRRKNKPQCVAPQKKYHANSQFIQPIMLIPSFFHCQKFSQGFREPSRKYFSPGTSHKISRVCYFINLHLDNEKQAPKTSLPPVCHKRQLLRKIVGLLHSTP